MARLGGERLKAALGFLFMKEKLKFDLLNILLVSIGLSDFFFTGIVLSFIAE